MNKITLKLLLLIFVSTSSVVFSQHKIKGIMIPKPTSDWIILYKIENTKQVFVSNTSIKSDSIKIDNKKEVVGTFEISLPETSKPGAYRITYALERVSFVDFFYNKEDVYFQFNPQNPEQTIVFTQSVENKLYQEYLDKIGIAQEKLDSIQISVFQNSTLSENKPYQKALSEVKKIQNQYEELTKINYINPFIKASARNNSPEIQTSPEKYLSSIKNSYFDNINFSDKILRNASFLTNKILEYVFYLNYSEDKITQQNLYKEAIKNILSKIKDQEFQKIVIENLITQFGSIKNLEIIDYLFENHYNKLPENLQDNKFRTEKLALFVTEIGRIAPDFSWTENGQKMQLSSLNDANEYVLVFWSSSCSHCLREIPLLHSFLENKKTIKVVAFALEKDAFVWENYSKTNLFGWHNVLGLKKWENEIAKSYQIVSTPTYFILDKDKKIIAKPDSIDDVKAFFEQK